VSVGVAGLVRCSDIRAPGSTGWPAPAGHRSTFRPGRGFLPLRGLLCIVLALPLLFVPPAFAAPGQTAFRLIPGSDSVTLDYRIEDAGGDAHRLRFSLPAQILQQARQRFKAYDPGELQREADAETLRQIEAAVGQLRGRYPRAAFEIRADRSIHWTVGSPLGFEERRGAIYDQRLASEIADLRATYPQATIESRDGRFLIRAPDESQLRRIEERLRAAQRSANQALADYAQQAKTEVEGDAQAIRTRIESDLAGAQRRVREFAEGFFQERLYTLSEDNALRPDYARIARLALDDLAPAASAMRRWTQGMSRREALGHLLLFIQSIPYDRLEDRRTGAGFLLPALVLAENRGDCDSKAVTFAALAHLLYPDLPIALVLLPRHAYLALGLAPEPGDGALKLDRKTWTLAEAAGPGLLPIGRLAGETQGQRDDIKAVVPLFH
jgi:hypothetical protein